jgi:diketogulonate reductase-like aldo/keto reductase
MHHAGASLIDSSPMYGRSEEVIGNLLHVDALQQAFFYATKVWTEGRQQGIDQMELSMQKMGVAQMDLMQIHNLVDWRTHLKTLRQWKEQGRIRYIGITHYVDCMHDALEEVLRSEQIDFVQFNYSVFTTHAEERLLPAAAELGVATLINRPFGQGDWFAKVQDKAMPDWALDHGIRTWSRFFLGYILAHPAVTCVIPGTGNPAHMRANLEAAEGNLPDAAMLRKMREYIGLL